MILKIRDIDLTLDLPEDHLRGHACDPSNPHPTSRLCLRTTMANDGEKDTIYSNKPYPSFLRSAIQQSGGSTNIPDRSIGSAGKHRETPADSGELGVTPLNKNLVNNLLIKNLEHHRLIPCHRDHDMSSITTDRTPRHRRRDVDPTSRHSDAH